MTTEADIDAQAISDFVQRAAEIEAELRKVIVGQQEVVAAGADRAVRRRPRAARGRARAWARRCWSARSAEVLSLRFSRIQFTPDLMPADIVGTNIVSRTSTAGARFASRPGPIFANIVLADEINRATPKTQSALLEAMQEQHGQRRRSDAPAAASRSSSWPPRTRSRWRAPTRCPRPQLDRFFFKVLVPFPRHDELEEILQRTIRAAAPDAHRSRRGGAEDVLRMLRVVARGASSRRTWRLRGADRPGDPPDEGAPPPMSAVRSPRGEPARTAGPRRGRAGAGAARRSLQRLARRPAGGGAARPAAPADPGLRGAGRRRDPRAPGQRRPARPSRSRGRDAARPRPDAPLSSPASSRVLEIADPGRAPRARAGPSRRAMALARQRLLGRVLRLSHLHPRRRVPPHRLERVCAPRAPVRAPVPGRGGPLARGLLDTSASMAWGSLQGSAGRSARRRPGVHRPAERRPRRGRHLSRAGVDERLPAICAAKRPPGPPGGCSSGSTFDGATDLQRGR